MSEQNTNEIPSNLDYEPSLEITFNMKHCKSITIILSNTQIGLLNDHELCLVSAKSFNVIQKMETNFVYQSLLSLKNSTICVLTDQSIELFYFYNGKWNILKRLTFLKMNQQKIFYCINQNTIVLFNNNKIIHYDINLNQRYSLRNLDIYTVLQCLDNQSYLIFYNSGLIENRHIKTGEILHQHNLNIKFKNIWLQDDGNIEVVESLEKQSYLLDSELNITYHNQFCYSYYYQYLNRKQLSSDLCFLILVKEGLIKQRGTQLEQTKSILRIQNDQSIFFEDVAIDSNSKNLYLLFSNDNDQALIQILELEAIMSELE